MEPIVKFYIQDQKIWRSLTTHTLPTHYRYHVVGAATKIGKFTKICAAENKKCLICNKTANIRLSVNNINELLCNNSEHYDVKFPAIEIKSGVYKIEIQTFPGQGCNIIIDTLNNNFAVENKLCNINQVVNYKTNYLAPICEICYTCKLCNCRQLVVPFIVNILSAYKLLLATLICDDVAVKIVIIWYNLV